MCHFAKFHLGVIYTGHTSSPSEYGAFRQGCLPEDHRNSAAPSISRERNPKEEIRTRKSLARRARNLVTYGTRSRSLAGITRNAATFGRVVVLTRWINQELSGTAWEVVKILIRYLLFFNTPVRFGFFLITSSSASSTRRSPWRSSSWYGHYYCRRRRQACHVTARLYHCGFGAVPFRFGTITLGARFSVCLRSCWVQYFWVYGVPVLPESFSYSARSVLRLSCHLDGLPRAAVRDKVLGLRFRGGTSMETTVQFFFG